MAGCVVRELRVPEPCMQLAQKVPDSIASCKIATHKQAELQKSPLVKLPAQTSWCFGMPMTLPMKQLVTNMLRVAK